MTLTSLYQAKKWGIRDLERRIDMGDIKKEELCNNYDDISDFEDFFTNEALKLETKHENLNKKNRMEERLIKDGIELEIVYMELSRFCMFSLICVIGGVNPACVGLCCSICVRFCIICLLWFSICL